MNSNQESEEDELDFLNTYLNNQNEQPSVLSLYFNKQILSEQDKYNVRPDEDELVSPSHNKELDNFPKKQGFLVNWENIRFIIGGQKDAGILDSPLNTRKSALDIQLKVLQSLLNANDQSFCVGRILQNGETFKKGIEIQFIIHKEYEQLYQKSHPIYFQSSLQGGKVLELNPSRLDEYFLYPGKIVAFEFENDQASILEPIRICHFNQSQPVMEEELPMQHKEKNALAIILAAGPFTNEDSLRYKHLCQLIEKIQQKKLSCDVLILLGPIISETNKHVENLDLEYCKLYDNVIQLVEMELPRVKVIVVNSTKEVLNLHPLPQPAYDYQQINKRQEQGSNIKHIGNPALIDFDFQCQIAIMNADIFFELKKKALYKGDDTKMFQTIRRELIEQRSFFPIFPPLDEVIDQTKVNEELSMVWNNENNMQQMVLTKQFSRVVKGLKHLDEDQFVQQSLQQHIDFTMPNIFISPSKLGLFIHPEDDCLFINPGKLSRGEFVHIMVHTNTGQSIIKNLRAEILRL